MSLITWEYWFEKAKLFQRKNTELVEFYPVVI